MNEWKKLNSKGRITTGGRGISKKSQPLSMDAYYEYCMMVRAARQATLDSLQLNGRAIVYPNQVPFDTDILRTNLYLMTAVDALSATVLGIGTNYSTKVRGFPCVPISPPGLSVLTGSLQTPDIIYSLQELDATDYGSLPADTTASNGQFKQGFNWGQVTSNTPAPVTPGNTVIHLIQVAFETQDVNDVSRPYFNSVDPPSPIFENNFDTRTDLAIIGIKLGVEGTSPTPPTPDPGYIGLYYITVTYGQTSIVSGNIAKVSSVEGQPFITESLTNKVSASDISGTYATIANIQTGQYTYALDSGTPNNVVANPFIPYTAYDGPYGHGYIIVNIAPGNTNTSTSCTINVSGLGALPIKKQAPVGFVVIEPGDMVQSTFAVFYLDANSSQAILVNPATDIYSTLSTFASISFSSAGTQTIATSGSLVKVLFDGTPGGTMTWWDSVNHWFLPTLAGHYQIDATVNSIGTSALQSLSLIQNGSSNIFSVSELPTSSGNPQPISISNIVSANGISDNFALAWTNSSGLLATTLGTDGVTFPGNVTNSFSIRYLGN